MKQSWQEGHVDDGWIYSISLGFKTCHRENLLEGRGDPNMRDTHTPPLEGSILTEQGFMSTSRTKTILSSSRNLVTGRKLANERQPMLVKITDSHSSRVGTQEDHCQVKASLSYQRLRTWAGSVVNNLSHLRMTFIWGWLGVRRLDE